MIAAWMVYALTVGALVAIGAAAAERAARTVRWSTRWVWLTALLLTVGLAGRAALHSTSPVTLPRAAAAVAAHEAAPIDHWRAIVASLAAFLAAPDAVQRTAAQRLSGLGNSYVIVLWAVSSMALTGLVLAVHGRFRRERTRWPVATIGGQAVRVAPNAGPAVFGVVRTEIVVPRWLLERAAHEQQLVVAHEAEHVRVGDPLLLSAAWVAALLAPWHAAVWYMLSRLRLAIELDCDARVLRRGAAAGSYGRLLIDVAEQSSLLRTGAIAMADDSSHLNRRILAMDSRRPRFASVRAAVAAAVAALTLLAACEAKLLTPSHQSAGAGVQPAMHQLTSLNASDTTHYWVNGVEVSPASATKPVASASAPRTVRIPPELQAAADSEHGNIVGTVLRAGGNAVTAPTPAADGPLAYFIDGVRADSAALAAIDRKTIVSVDVLKGATPRALYDAPNARGIIDVRTTGAARAP